METLAPSKKRGPLFLVAADMASVQRFRFHLIETLVSLGYGVYVCCPFGKGFEAFDLQLRSRGCSLVNVPFRNTSFNVFQDIKCFFQLFFLILKYKPSCVLLFNIKPVIWGSFACLFFRHIKCISMLTGLGYLYTSKKKKILYVRRLANFLYKISLKHNFKVFFQNPCDLAYFRRYDLVPSGKALQIRGSGVNLQDFPFSELPHDLSFVFIGRLIVDKGLQEYLEAAAFLKKKYPHVIFRLVGGTSSNPSALSIREIQEYCLASQLVYEGEVKDVRAVLEKSSVFVLPSYREGTSRAGLEALSVGRPIITTKAAGCSELVLRNKNGLLIPKKDVKALIEAMDYFIVSPKDVLTEMGGQSRLLAERFFDVRKVNQFFIEHCALL